MREYDIPSRVCSDKAGENTMMCYFMVSQRRTGRGSHIAGRSTHNQRIERLLRDVYFCVASTYEVFYYNYGGSINVRHRQLVCFALCISSMNK